MAPGLVYKYRYIYSPLLCPFRDCDCPFYRNSVEKKNNLASRRSRFWKNVYNAFFSRFIYMHWFHKKFARERPIPVSGYLHSLGDLNEWCSDNAVFPANEDVSYGSSSIFDDLSFRFSMSTYKLNWNGLALIVLGIVDIQKKFHPLLYACVSYETTDDYTQFRLWVIVKCHWSILREHFRANYTDCWWCDGNQECILQCLWFGGTRHHVIRSYHSQCSKEAICNEK